MIAAAVAPIEGGSARGPDVTDTATSIAYATAPTIIITSIGGPNSTVRGVVPMPAVRHQPFILRRAQQRLHRRRRCDEALQMGRVCNAGPHAVLLKSRRAIQRNAQVLNIRQRK